MFRKTTHLIAFITFFGALISAHDEARSAEGGAGFYLLGLKTSMAGFVPPPGTYVQDVNLFYGGGATRELPIAGQQLRGDVSGDVYLKVANIIWVLPEPVLGGSLGLNAIVPVGWKRVQADLRLGPFSRAVDESAWHFGDPVLGATLGWHSGNWHWNIGGLLNVPIGDYEAGDVTNVSFNRWAFDASAAITWLDMASGVELSAAAGFTFNGENPATDYKTGTEFHLEFAAVQNLSKQLGIGVNGYWYEQVTGDSGSGAVLGSFKGETVALGPVVNFNFQLGELPVSGSVKYLHEITAKRRLTGSSSFLTFTMPLSVSTPVK